VNDGKEVEIPSYQIMKCILWVDNAVNILNPGTKKRKGLITYYKTYGILIVLKKHVDPNHSIIVKKSKEEVNNEIIGSVESQLAKKRTNVPTKAIYIYIYIYIFVKEPFKNDYVQ